MSESSTNAVPPDPSPFGRALAEKLADHLVAGGQVLHGWSAHQLLHEDGHYTWQLLKDTLRVLFRTPDREVFVSWFAAQSAASLDAQVRPATTDTIEVLTAERLRRAITEQTPPDRAPYGRALAERVARALRGGSQIAYVHRDYCGTGLFYENGEFLHAHVNDGYPSDAIDRFTDEASFVAWLAAQSDHSLAGRTDEERFARDNQRITRERLVAAVGEG